jgi:hypothetical protein
MEKCWSLVASLVAKNKNTVFVVVVAVVVSSPFFLVRFSARNSCRAAMLLVAFFVSSRNREQN